MEFIMLLRPVDLMNVILLLYFPINIQQKETSLGDFVKRKKRKKEKNSHTHIHARARARARAHTYTEKEKSQEQTWLAFGHLRRISFKLGMMIDSTRVYRSIPV